MWMDNLCLGRGNINPLYWLLNLVKPIMLFGDDDSGGGGDDGDDGKNKDTGHFSSGFTEDLRSHPSVQKFKSTEEMAKSYVNLETKIGARGVIIPAENAGEEEIANFHKALGAVDKAESVEIVTLPEGSDERLQVTEESTQSFKEFAVKSHFTQGQIKSLQEWNTERQINALTAYDKTVEDEKNANSTKLHQEWGAKYDENLTKANQLVKTLGGQEALDWFSKGEGNNPIVLKLLANIAGKVSEDVLGEKGSSGVLKTPAQAKIEIQQIRDNEKSAFNDGNHRDHKEAVAYMSSLYAMANPEPAK